MSSDELITEDVDTLHRFALDLRALKQEAGDPTLASLSVRTGISKSVLSEALSGKRLPTEKTVRHLVKVLGHAPDEWIARRNALAFGIAPTAESARPAAAAGASPAASRRPIVVAAVASGLGAAVLTSAVWTGALTLGLGKPNTAASPAETALLEPGNGVDPMLSVCREDAVIAASEARLENDVQVQILYSTKCQAVWGRVTRYDGKSAGNVLEMRIYPAVDMDSPRNQERRAYDLQSIYTTMLIEPDVEARVCGIATVSVDGETIELAPPLCI